MAPLSFYLTYLATPCVFHSPRRPEMTMAGSTSSSSATPVRFKRAVLSLEGASRQSLR